MNETAKKTKLCWNCDGVVERSAENCIYCGVYLHPDQEATTEKSTPSQPPEHEPIYSSESLEEETEDEVTHSAQEDSKGIIFSFLFLLTGSFFLLFSFILYFFSKDGVFVLKWNADYWFLYLLFAIPLLLVGWRTLQKFEH